MNAVRVAFIITALIVSVSSQAKASWPSYNRGVASQRFAPLNKINRKNVYKLKVVCSYDSGRKTSFQSGLIQADDALFAATEHDTISIDPDTCKLNWRVHEKFKTSPLDANRGVAYANGRVFRGADNGYVYAYDAKTGRRLWKTRIADASKGETVPAAPITWDGLLFIGTAGGDTRGVKGRMYALDTTTGEIAWERYLVPESSSDNILGPSDKDVSNEVRDSWRVAPGIQISGGGNWTSYTLDPDTGLLYIPGGNPAPDFVERLRKGKNLFTGTVVALDARTGAYRRYFEIVPYDFHDWDVSSAPALFTTQDGRRVMAVAPKDGHLYGFDLSTGQRLYKRPRTTIYNAGQPLSSDKRVRFCPGTHGGSLWNGPAYDAKHDAVIVGQVDWCSSVRLGSESDIRSVPVGQLWTGTSNKFFGKQDPTWKWSGWVVSSDAATGNRRWTFKTRSPVVSGVTPTAGNLVFFGDLGGELYALNSDTGFRLWSTTFDGSVAGGVITYNTGAEQKIAVGTGLKSSNWPKSLPDVTAHIYILGLEQNTHSRDVILNFKKRIDFWISRFWWLFQDFDDSKLS